MKTNRNIGLLSAFALLLAGCTMSTDTMALQPKDGVPVNIHGVNYTADPFRYRVVDPNDPSNSGGGEHIGPFSGGGITCCYVLPKQWRPGIQVQVYSTHWLPRDVKGNLPEMKKVYTVEVPPYIGGKAGELWVLRTATGGVEVVSSDFQPDHPSWPGKVKGWPEPSLEFRRARWSIYKEQAEHSVENYKALLQELQTDVKRHAESSWDHDKKYNKDDVNGFAGPSDPAYSTYLLKRYSDGLKRAQARLEQLNKEAP